MSARERGVDVGGVGGVGGRVPPRGRVGEEGEGARIMSVD